MGIEERALGVAGLALDQRKGEVAAEDDAAGAADAVVQARRDRADAGNRHDAKRDTGDEHAEAAQTAAQIAPNKARRKTQCEAQRRQRARFCRGRQHQVARGRTRAKMKCVGANTNTGMPSNNPPNQM